MKPQRLRLSRIENIELWDLETDDGLMLYEGIGTPGFGRRLVSSLLQLRNDEARNRWSRTPLHQCKGFDRLVVAGGAVPEALRWPDALSHLNAGPFGPAAGAASVAASELGGELLSRDPRRWLAIDVGQTAIKAASSHDYRRHAPRDLAELPLRQPGTTDQTMKGNRVDLEEQRRRLRLFLSEHIGQAITDNRPDGLLLALPCELDDALSPKGSSYIGMGGDPSLINDVLRTSGSAGIPTWVLNDAELAAFAALPTVGAGEKALVVTLGFAVGGAVIHRQGDPT